MTDVDDDELGSLFRAAASDSGAPPPGFDHRSVVAASRRVTVRRRAAVTGLGLAVFAVVGVGGLIVVPSNQDGGSGGSAPVAAPMLAPAPEADTRARARDQAAPPAAGMPDGATVPEAAAVGGPPLGPGTAECADRQDPELRALVEQVLPQVVGAPEAAITMECRPVGERGVSVEVSDGAVAGLLTVSYLPPGAAASVPAGGVSAPTASGGTVVVNSSAGRPGAPPPLADRLQDAVSYLAPRL